MSTVIKVENLSKKYIISHKRQERYTALRDVMTNKVKGLFSKDRKSDLAREEFWALKDINFEVKKGDRIGIIGRNGAGKSTLLKILSRITEPTKGRISIKGRIASLLEVGTGFHPELTGRENIFLNGAILGMTKFEIKKKFDEIVAFAEVEKFLDTPVKHYSSGMYVRLAFAVAAHLESEILLVDEVLAVGDIQFQKKCLGKMDDVTKGGRTVLFVSHNMSAISSLCGRLVVLSAGQIRYNGNVRKGISYYMSSIEKGSHIDFQNFCGERRGIKKFSTLISMSLFDENGKECDTFAMGQVMLIRLKIYIKHPINASRIGVMLRNQMDVLIHDFTSGFDGFIPDLKPGLREFEIRVEKIMVYPGQYTLGAWIQQMVGVPSDDYIRAALTINIIDNKLVGHLEASFDRITSDGTEVYVPCQWKEIF